MTTLHYHHTLMSQAPFHLSPLNHIGDIQFGHMWQPHAVDPTCCGEQEKNLPTLPSARVKHISISLQLLFLGLW